MITRFIFQCVVFHFILHYQRSDGLLSHPKESLAINDVIRWPKPLISPSTSIQAITDLISRVLDGAPTVQLFQVLITPDLAAGDKDAFLLTNGDQPGTILISATSGVAAAWGFNYYLKYVANSSVYWSGKNIRLSGSKLIPLSSSIRIVANDIFRWYGNPCTFSYSAAFWNFSRWEKEIDWMALNGINIAYATTGMEYIFTKVFLRLGFNQSELDDFFTGPAFLAWHRMGNLQKHAGPLPQSWLESQFELAKQIIARMTAIGIIPVLPAFTGFMPQTAPVHFPSAKFYISSDWVGIGCNDSCLPYLDPADPFFQEVGMKLLNETITLLNITSHYYACDLFNEMPPPISDLNYLADVNAGVYQAMRTVDPDAVWVMLAWLFLEEFWTPPRVQSYLSKVPRGHLILLDLASETRPQYSRLDSYYGHHYIWNMLHNFGGNNYMFGSLESVNQGPQTARSFSGDQMLGVGITMEGINQNEIMYEFALEQSWRIPLSDPQIDDWLAAFASRRYSNDQPAPDSTLDAWQFLGNSVYKQNPDGSRSLLLDRPGLGRGQSINFNLQSLISAWELLVNASSTLDGDLFRYDLVDVTKEVVQYIFASNYIQMNVGYKLGNLTRVSTQVSILVDILADLEMILASDRRFLLGNWVGDALQFAQTDADIRFYNYNAKLQVTLWGNNDTGELFDYACKLWSGMIRHYYAPRWFIFFGVAIKSLVDGQPIDINALNQRLFFEAEYPFYKLDIEQYPRTAEGDSIMIARELFNKYRSALNDIHLPANLPSDGFSVD